MSEEEVLPLLNKLWDVTFNYGGIFFASRESIWGKEVGHLNGLFAIRMAQSGRYFLISDPEIPQFKLLTFNQMRDVIASPKVNFDLFNV